MFERFADDAKRAIFFANIEATHRSEPAVSVKDLLVGLTWESDCPPQRVALLKERAVELRAALGIPHLPSTSIPYRNEAQIPLDGDAKKVIAYAVQEANHDKRYWVGADDLLRALLRFPNAATGALRAFKIELDAVRTMSRESRIAAPDKPTPRWMQCKAMARKHWVAVLFLLLFLVAFAYLKSQG